jgi:mRNA-degrading endonuclease RelE of RelBE toxin-antitoxin system
VTSRKDIECMRTFNINPAFFAAAHELPKEVAKKAWKALHLFSENPRHPSLQYETLRGALAGLASIRVDDNYRIILLENDRAFTLLYVGSHDKAYRQAARATFIGARAFVAEEPTVYRVPPAEEVFQLPERELSMSVGTIKYLPLATFLVTRPKLQKTVELKFKEIEQIIGESLPPSARKHAAWWSNEGSDTRHVQAHAWMAVGWRVHADRSISKATFERVE